MAKNDIRILPLFKIILSHPIIGKMNSEEVEKVIQNQRILDRKLDNILSELKTVNDKVQIAINNQQIIEQYEIDLTDRLKRIENKINNL